MIVSMLLEELVCADQFRPEGCAPYAWGVLLQIDDDTIASGVGVATVAFAAPPDGAWTVIASGMHAGDSASFPDPEFRYAARFRSGQTRNDLILVTVLWDSRDTPLYAIAAGYDAFLGEIRQAIEDNLLALATADDAEQAVIEKAISQRVHDRVEAAVTGKLSTLDKLQFQQGLKTPDKLVGSEFLHLSVPPQDSQQTFSLGFNDDLNDNFGLSVRMTVVADPCEDLAVRVRSLQLAIVTTRGALKSLYGQEGSAVEEEIEQLEAELADQKTRLQQALAALAACRADNP